MCIRDREQITDAEQMLAISKALEYLIKKYGGKEISLNLLLDDIENLMEKKGVQALTGRGSAVSYTHLDVYKRQTSASRDD